MKPVVDLEECLKDSPLFRETIESSADDIDCLEQRLEKLVRQCNGMVDAGKMFISSKNAFINGIKEIGLYFEADVIVADPLKRFIHALQEVSKYENILMEQAQRSVVKNINKFVRTDIKHVKETKRHFEKISDDLDNALIRNSSVPRSKTHECDEANNILTATRSCFQYTALDYVYQLSILHSKKRFEVLDTLLSLMHAYTTYYHQGSDLYQDVDPYLKQLDPTLTKLRSETSDMEKTLESRHLLVTQKDFVPTIVKLDDTSNSIIRLEGYLFKRTSNAFKTWNRRWFIIQNNQLVYRKRSRGDNLTVMEEDLRLCTVKPVNDLDRRFCFEVLSPSKSHVLQADSEESCKQWKTAMQAGINAALHYPLATETNDKDSLNSSSLNRPCSILVNSSAPPKPPRAHNQILSLLSNEICCDCKSSDPRWASINLGITLCIECSGIHRSLGVHVSKVRSLTLDAWEPELLKVMAELGNNLVNSLYESNVDESVAVRATADCSRDVREQWIKAKYVKKAFVKPLLLKEDETENPSNEVANRSQQPQQWTVRRINRKRRVVKVIQQQQDNLNLEVPSLRETSLSVNSESGSVSCESIQSKSSGTPVEEADYDVNKDTSEKNNSSSESADVLLFGNVDPCDVDLDSADESTLDDEEAIVEIPVDEIANLSPNMLLYRASAVHNLPAMCQALASGASPNWANPDDDGQLPLHQAIRSGSIMACEYLMLNGSRCNNVDKNGRTSLHLATELGHTGQVCLLLKRGVDQNAVDAQGKTALSVAIDKANADIVTLLRLAKLNEEIRRDEFGNPGDETFNEVVRDFSHMASHNPEKLRRNPSAVDG